jgi:Na+/melibiose symporter-like transporter
MICSIITVSLVFTSVGWEEYVANPGIDVIFGLRLLVFLFPTVAIIISLILLYFYPFTKEYVHSIKEKLAVLHSKKASQIIESDLS